MELSCGSCTLRPFRPSDAESLARQGNDRRVWINLRDRFPHPYTLDDAHVYIAEAGTMSPPTRLAIVVDDSAMGGISLRPGQDIERRSAELGYWLGEEYWGRGIMTDAVRRATEYAFRELDMLRIFAIPFAPNHGSARVLEKAGYQREGVLRASAIKDGVVLDQYLYAIIRPDAYAPRP